MTLKAGGRLNILHVLRAPVGGLFRPRKSKISITAISYRTSRDRSRALPTLLPTRQSVANTAQRRECCESPYCQPDLAGDHARQREASSWNGFLRSGSWVSASSREASES